MKFLRNILFGSSKTRPEEALYFSRRHKKLQQEASGIERHCAIELCKADGVNPHQKVCGVELWMHYLGTVRNVLTITRLAREFENAER